MTTVCKNCYEEDKNFVEDIARAIYVLIALCLAIFLFKDNFSEIGQSALAFLAFIFISYSFRTDAREDIVATTVEIILIAITILILFNDFHFVQGII